MSTFLLWVYLQSYEQLVHVLSSADVSSTTNARSETGQMTVCRQNLMLGANSNRSAFSLLVGALFKKFSLFLNRPRIFVVL